MKKKRNTNFLEDKKISADFSTHSTPFTFKSSIQTFTSIFEYCWESQQKRNNCTRFVKPSDVSRFLTVGCFGMKNDSKSISLLEKLMEGKNNPLSHQKILVNYLYTGSLRRQDLCNKKCPVSDSQKLTITAQLKVRCDKVLLRYWIRIS